MNSKTYDSDEMEADIKAQLGDLVTVLDEKYNRRADEDGDCGTHKVVLAVVLSELGIMVPVMALKDRGIDRDTIIGDTMKATVAIASKVLEHLVGGDINAKVLAASIDPSEVVKDALEKALEASKHERKH
jgi:hypothetical protein